MIVVPAIDLLGGRVVRLERGRAETAVVFDQDPVARAGRFEAEGAKRIHVVRSRCRSGRRVAAPNPSSGLRRRSRFRSRWAAASAICPSRRGSKARESIRLIFGTAAVEAPALVSEAIRRWPTAVAVAIDARDGWVQTRGWTKKRPRASRCAGPPGGHLGREAASVHRHRARRHARRPQSRHDARAGARGRSPCDGQRRRIESRRHSCRQPTGNRRSRRGDRGSGRCTRIASRFRRRAWRQGKPMLAKRIVPCLDIDRGRVVKGVRFVELRDAGDPTECGRRYDLEGADELVLLDITAFLRRPAHPARRRASRR